MSIDSISGQPSSAAFDEEEQLAGPQSSHDSPQELPSAETQGGSDYEDAASIAASYKEGLGGPQSPHDSPHELPSAETQGGSDHEDAASIASSHSSVDSFDPSNINEGRIASNLRGTPIENPLHVPVGDRLLPDLAAPGHSSEPGPSSAPKSRMAQVSSNVADAGAKLARQVSAPVTNLAKKLAPPKQAKTTPEELDRRKREQELQKRDRTLDGMQDNEGFEARRKLRGGTRE